MKLIKPVVLLALVLAPGLAAAQGYSGGPGGPQQIPGGFHDRTGQPAWGFGAGLGGMHDDGGQITCNNCDYNPVAGEFDAHIGGMLSPRFALLLELQVNGQTLSSNAYADTVLTQSAAMVAGQFWLTPQLWIKGGLGFAHLDVQDNYNGTYQPVSDGAALLGAVGFELLSAQTFALDLQARIIEGSYNGINDHVTSGTVGLELNWYRFSYRRHYVAVY